MCGSGRAVLEGCRYGLVGVVVGLRDGVWFISSSGRTMVGAETGSVSGSLIVFHDPNATVCSILGAPGIFSMAAIENLAWVAPLDE